MKSKASHSQGMLLFKLNETQIFAIGTLKVKELVPYMKLTSLPQSHPTVLGAANIRGANIPVIDMAAAIGYPRLSEEELKHSFIIITDCQRKETGFAVKYIDKIMDCNWRDIKPPPANAGKNVYVTGVTELNKKLVQLLDIELLLSIVYPSDPVNTYPSLTDIQRELMKPLNILLVDDSLVARKQLSDALNGLNIPYWVASNGHEALNIMEEVSREGNPIHILVSDIEMPGLDGYELTFEIRDKTQLSNVYIILHTSLSSQISVSQAQQVGANEALEKFDAHELIDAMLRGADFHAKSIT